MTEQQNRLLNLFRRDLTKINDQRSLWLMLSSLVFVSVIAIIVSWNYLVLLDSSLIWWSVISIGLTVTVNWWYWSMHLIRKLLHHQITVVDILVEITNEVKGIRDNINNIKPK